ncbi:MAG: helix-turn-helix transcriptional regulator [Desulfamplus sp.]|nr:helix-turn-helix transcriptional regulator [Desulfamplus sp.]
MIFNSEEFKRIRKEKKMSLREVAKRTTQYDPQGKGVTESTIQRLESGTRDNLKLDSLVMMIKAVGESNLNKFVNWGYFQKKEEL